MIEVANANERFHTWVVPEMNRRIESDSLLIREMVTIRGYYEGDYMIPTPDVDGSPSLPRSTPLLMQEAIDNAARVASSQMFSTDVPVVKRSGWSSDDAKLNASKRRQALAAVRDASKFPLLRRRGFRHLSGYATYSMACLPDMKAGLPILELWDPLLTYPEPKSPDDVSDICDVGTIRTMSAAALRYTYPTVRSENGGPICQAGSEDLWDLVKWIDHEWVCFGLLGPRMDASGKSVDEARQAHPSMLLSAYPNLAGRCLAVAPRRVTMSRIASQMHQLTGIVDLLDRLQALDIEASEKSIYPDVYITGNEAQPPQLVGDEWHDGRTGRVNLIRNAENVGVLRSAPDQNSKMAADRLERNFRIGTGLVPQTGGETYGALRTGRGIDSLMAAAVDPRIQEIHETDQEYQSILSSITLDVYKGWWGSTKMEVFPGWRSGQEILDFTPGKDIPVSHVKCEYPFPGQEISQITITLGQLLGTKAISVRTFRKKHPWIDDEIAEGAQIDEESMEEFALQAIFAQIQEQALPPIYLAKLEKHRRKPGNDIFAAIEAADEEIRKEQEAQAQAQQELAADQVPPPELQPGLGPAPGGGPPQPIAPQAPPMIDPQVQQGASQASALLSALESGAA